MNKYKLLNGPQGYDHKASESSHVDTTDWSELEAYYEKKLTKKVKKG